MPYETVGGSFEHASRLSHSSAAVRAIADRREFFVPAEALRDVDAIKQRIRKRTEFVSPKQSDQLTVAIAIDGSYTVEPVRDGMPSVMYGYAQVAAAYIDLEVMETQRAEQFVDPYAIENAVNTAVISLDLPTAGAYTREGVDISTSWREDLNRLFRDRKVEIDNIDKSLLDLLFMLKGKPGNPASVVPVNCPACRSADVPVPSFGVQCPDCGIPLYPTDTLRIHEGVTEDGDNKMAMGRLMSVLELLVLVGLVTYLWEVARKTHLPKTLFIVDGPLAVFGESAKLRLWALEYFQAMAETSTDNAPLICGIEKFSPMADFASQLAKHDILEPGDLLICDEAILSRVINSVNVTAYGENTYWGRKFIYRALDGRVVVLVVMPPSGHPYSKTGGMTCPENYPTLPEILDVVDRTGSSMYVNGIIPVAVAHGKAAFPLGLGTDVLRLVAMKRLGLDANPST